MYNFLWFCSVFYLFYLASVTQTILFNDGISYHHLAQIFQHQGWVEYWSTGPNREPLYPWFVSVVLRLADGLKMNYEPVLFLAQIFVFLSMLWILDRLLQKARIGLGIRILVLLYAVFSPAFMYTIFIEWSEIVSYPLVLIIIWVCLKAWNCVYKPSHNKLMALGWGAVLALAVLSLTAVKANMEIVAMFLILPWVYTVFKYWRKFQLRSSLAICVIIGFLTLDLAAINFYKWQNWHYNGQYVLVDRGSRALYGNIARRMVKLTPIQWEAAVLSIPTDGAECWSVLKPSDVCRYWTYMPSDEMGHGEVKILAKQGIPKSRINEILIKMSLEKMGENPLKALILMLMEGLKFMFWELNSTPEFTVYPLWLQHIYENAFIHAFLHFGVALLTFISFVHALFFLVKKRNKIFSPDEADFDFVGGIFFISFFITLFIFFYTFFYCSGRYAMPLAPLYLILIAFFLKNSIMEINKFIVPRLSRKDKKS